MARRTQSEMQRLRDELFRLAEEHRPLTVRQLFYRAVSTGLIEKTQAEYSNVVVRLVGEMRERDELPWDWIIDTTRWMQKARSYSSFESALTEMAETYRRDVWDNQSDYVEVWCESDSAGGILYPATEHWDVPLMPCHGQPSKTFVRAAAEMIEVVEKPTYVYYFGDFDKSGEDISARIERDLRRYLPSHIELHFERVAINEDQIAEYNLPTRPPKDTRGGWNKETVDLEAMTTAQLQMLSYERIEQHVHAGLHIQRLVAEKKDKELLRGVLSSLKKRTAKRRQPAERS